MRSEALSDGSEQSTLDAVDGSHSRASRCPYAATVDRRELLLMAEGVEQVPRVRIFETMIQNPGQC